MHDLHAPHPTASHLVKFPEGTVSRDIGTGGGWVISAQGFNPRIDVELTERDDERSAASFIAKVLADLGLT